MIENFSRGTVVARRVVLCRSIWSQARGLMFSKKSFVPLLFDFKREKIVPLHMFFVFFPIDVLYVSSSFHVVCVKQNFMPFTYFHPRTRARYVLEIPAGSIEKSKTQKGDELRIAGL